MIVSSINMHCDTLLLVSRSAEKLHISKRTVVLFLLMRVMRDVGLFQRGFTTVKYQPDNKGMKWHCFSIKLNPDENEFLADLRKVCKCSVSFLVAIAARKYLDELLAENGDRVHYKVLFRDYLIHGEIIDGIICWHLYWGMPTGRLHQIVE